MTGLISMEDMINWKTLYVSNIDRQATKTEIKMDLQALCPRDLGAVVVPVDQVDTTTVGIAYCNFKLSSDAADALSRYRFGTRVCGKPVSIAYSVVKERTKILGPWGNRLTIIIKNLSPEVTEKMLCNKFERFGNIFRCKVDIDSAGCKYGMAQYTKEASTIRSVECADNQTWFSTVIKVERHAKTRLSYGDGTSATPTPTRIPDVPASPIKPSGLSHINPAIPTASRVDNWPSEAGPWGCNQPPPPPRIQVKPSSSHAPAHHLEPSTHDRVPVSNSFAAVSEDYEVTINGTDFQSFELADDDIQGEVVDKSSSSTSTAERSLAASPEMGIIGFMTEQRKLYSKDAADPTGGVPGNRGKDMYTTGSHTREQPSEATDYGWRAKEPSGVQDPVHSTCPAVGSVEKHPVKPAVRHMNLKEAMQHVSQVEIALKSILGPLERITGHLKGEGLLCCPITQEMFEDPVVAADGYTYERTAIQEWLQRRNTSPYTNLVLSHTNVTPNTLVKNIVEEIKFQWK